MVTRELLRLSYAEEQTSTHGITKETRPYTTAAIVSWLTLIMAVLLSFDLSQLSLFFFSHHVYVDGYGDSLGQYIISKGADADARNNVGKTVWQGI